MNFDLNIDNYTKDELIQMFDLPLNFDRNIIDIKEAKMRDTITNNNKIQKDIQINAINFLIKAKNKILNSEQKNVNFMDYNALNTSPYEQTTVLKDRSEHMVQVKQEDKYITSLPSDFYKGTLNPLKKRVITRNLTIDSKFRDNYFNSTSTNFNVILPFNINNVLQIELTNIEFPTSFYTISKKYGNNFFYLTVNDSSIIITIPDGNYTESGFFSQINTQIAKAGSSYQYITFLLNTYGSASNNTITGSNQTLVGIDQSSSGSITSFELNFQTDINGNYEPNTPLPLKLGWILGFRNGLYVNNLNYVSEGSIDLNGPKYFFLSVDDYNNNVNNNYYSAFNSSLLNKNILARISNPSNALPQSTTAQGVNYISQIEPYITAVPRIYFGPVNIKNLNIQLLDEYGRIVNLNNMDYSFCINLISTYDL